MLTHTHKHIHTHAHTHAHTHTQITHTNARAHTYTYKHAHTHTEVSFLLHATTTQMKEVLKKRKRLEVEGREVHLTHLTPNT